MPVAESAVVWQNLNSINQARSVSSNNSNKNKWNQVQWSLEQVKSATQTFWTNNGNQWWIGDPWAQNSLTINFRRSGTDKSRLRALSQEITPAKSRKWPTVEAVLAFRRDRMLSPHNCMEEVAHSAKHLEKRMYSATIALIPSLLKLDITSYNHPLKSRHLDKTIMVSEARTAPCWTICACSDAYIQT